MSRSIFIPGLGNVAPQAMPVEPRYYDEPSVYVFQRTLAANQSLTDLSQLFDGDSLFLWMGVYGSQTGAYSIRFRSPNGRYLSSALLRNVNAIGTAQFPVPIFPALPVPISGKIGIDITDLSGAANSVEICFAGVKRFQL
jgi:hypothetical protein